MIKKILLSLVLFCICTSSISAQIKSSEPGVETIDEIVKEVLSLLSGEKGEIRDLERFRQLFLLTAQFTVLYHPIDSFPVSTETISFDDFIAMMNDQYYHDGFLEYETGKVVEEYSGIAHVFQSFYAKDSEGEEVRGVSSYQLVFFEDRW